MSDLIEMLDAASRDDRLADGMLYRKAKDRIEELQARVEALEGKLERINQWCLAYPSTIFIEPTKEQWRIANETLDAHRGDNCPSLTAISGSNMRHVVEGIAKIAATEQEGE